MSDGRGCKYDEESPKDEALLAALLLTSCYVAQFLTGHGTSMGPWPTGQGSDIDNATVVPTTGAPELGELCPSWVPGTSITAQAG